MAIQQIKGLFLVCLSVFAHISIGQSAPDNHSFQKGDDSSIISRNEIDFISDTQQPMVLEEVRLHRDHNIQATSLLLSDILHQKPLGIYMLGDIVALGSSNRKWSTMDRFIDSCRKNNIAVHGLLGNHDLMWSRKKGEINFQHRFADNVDIGYMSIIDSIAVVLLNSNFKKLSAIEINKQERWYTSTLDSLNSDISVKTIIVCCHHAPYSNSRIVGSSAQVRRYLLPAFMQTPKCNLFIAGHAHAFEHFKYSGKNFLVIGGGGGLHQPLDTSAGRLPDIAFNYKPRFHYLSIIRLGDTLLLTSRFLKSDFSGIEKGYSFRLAVR
ncbi:MAG TPA: metallophosphoesterase [Puia sp.]|nr:metallophosphoesterase [Puia sp.]